MNELDSEKIETPATRIGGFDIVPLAPLPPNTNPFENDAYHMGTHLGTNVTVMYEKYADEKQRYLIIINKETGNRIRINL